MVSTPLSPSRQNSVSFAQAGLKTAAASAAPPPPSRPHHPHHAGFEPLLQFLEQRLEPLVGCTSGQKPADFPDTILAYHLLTNEQLDNLARFFQQTSPPTLETSLYPVPIDKPWIGSRADAGVTLATKRRRFGRFIGLQGCESPTIEHGPFFEEPAQLVFEDPSPMDLDESALANVISEIMADDETSVQMMADMEYEWQAALAQAQAESCHSYGMK